MRKEFDVISRSFFLPFAKKTSIDLYIYKNCSTFVAVNM